MSNRFDPYRTEGPDKPLISVSSEGRMTVNGYKLFRQPKVKRMLAIMERLSKDHSSRCSIWETGGCNCGQS